MNSPRYKPKTLDLFCGAGGLALGFEQAGFQTIAGIDSDPQSLETFRCNFPGAKAFCSDISKLSELTLDFLRTEKDEIDVIVGGPPCQGFSIAGKRLIDDPRNRLYKDYINVVEFIKPQYVVMENVPNIRSMGGGMVSKSIKNDLADLGYVVIEQTVNASDYGVPQNRIRTFFIAKLNADPAGFPEPTTTNSKLSTQEAIGDLPKVDDFFEEHPIDYPADTSLTTYQKSMRQGSEKIYNHWSVRHKQKTREIIDLVPDGGNYKDLPISLQNTRKVNIAWTRMNSRNPSFTIDAGHNHHFHYEANRVPTVRESARIQSFPDTFIFLGNKTSQYRQVGNAVPPLLAKSLAEKIRQDLN